MIERVEVRNFQSLRNVTLDLGQLSVIVGPSNSGKSAFVRALRALASGAPGAGYVTRGADAAAITVRSCDAQVTLEYVKGIWRYRLVIAGHEDTYTKLNRAVPEAITAALHIDPVPLKGTSVNFAAQFDRPYLLTDTGAAVARELGALTNVDTIFHAVREANRRRVGALTTLKTRNTDLGRLTEQVHRFSSLPARLVACQRAEAAMDRATHLSGQLRRLGAAVEVLEAAQTLPAPPPAPSGAALTDAQTSLTRLRQLLSALTSAQQELARANQSIAESQTAETNFTTQRHEVLLRAGTCPTCQQPL